MKKKEIIINRLAMPIPKGWEVLEHNFYEVDPKSPYPQELIAQYLNANLFQAICGKYLVDVGFFGGHHYNTTGAFSLHLVRGNFFDGELLEKVRFTNLSSATQCLHHWMVSVTKDDYKELKGLKYAEDVGLIHFKEFSVTENKAIKW